MDICVYKSLRKGIIDAGYGADIEWAETVQAPKNADDFAGEYIWVVLNSGMKNTVAKGLMGKVWGTLRAGGRAVDVFGHPGKASAIDHFWQNREKIFQEFKACTDVLAFCEALSWIGPITKYHLAKNYGMDVAKPDRWLERVASVAGETVAALCQRLAQESGDRVATVDLVIWRACSIGLHRPCLKRVIF